MSKFVLTAQLQLQAPGNTRQVINQLRSQLQGQLNIPVSVTGSVQATKQIKQVTQQTQQATTAAHNMGKAFGASIKRFAAFNIATRAVGLLASKLSQAVDEAIEFQRQLVKISQVTGKTVNQLQDLTDTITRFATTLGVSSTALLGTTRILAQAGIQAGDLKIALEALAKTTLAPTFDNITQTAEGAVAILAQFGQGVGALEQQLGAINAVAGQFAVESGDLISSVRRMGGVFRQAGGDLNELLALFTSVRATTRENAESISTGLRTIFTRIQRPQTIEYLKQFGVELTDLNGKFIGPYEAVRQLSKALAGLDRGDIRFVEIAEQLGGFRQIGKVIPLLQQFETAERARQAAIEGGNSLNEDAVTAQQALAVQIEKTKEKFLALIRSISETSTFRIMIQSLLGIANAFIKVAEAIKPLIPLIAAFAAVKLTRGLGSFASGLGAGVRGKNQGGKIHAFASGGSVPGTGNRDTVPAMLTPGEFVIRKSSVNKIGAGTLAAMNENKYAKGGIITKPNEIGMFVLNPPKGEEAVGFMNSGLKAQITNPAALAKLNKGAAKSGGSQQLLHSQLLLNATGATQKSILGNNYSHITKREKVKQSNFNKTDGKPKGTDLQLAMADPGVQKRLNEFQKTGAGGKAAALNPTPVPISGPVSTFFTAGRDLKKSSGISKAVTNATKEGMEQAIKTAVNQATAILQGIQPIDANEQKVFSRSLSNLWSKGGGAIESIEGFIFEGLIGGLTGSAIAGGGSFFDFHNFAGIQRERLAGLFGAPEIAKLQKADAKRSFSPGLLGMGKGTIPMKIANDINAGDFRGVMFAAKGGAATGSDTVPAMLTPGEFVVNKKASQSIGYGNLNKMNKQGVVGFAKGGPVGVQKFGNGGGVEGRNAVAEYTESSKSINTDSHDPYRDIKKIRADLDAIQDKIPKLLYSGIGIQRRALIEKQIGQKIYAGSKGKGISKKLLMRAVGKSFSLPGYLSTSESPEVATRFMRGLKKTSFDRGVMLHITTKGKGIKVRPEEASQGMHEQESILHRNSRFAVKSMKPSPHGIALGVQQLAKGGIAGTDTVPAMLTPGEFVINKKASQSIGYGNLNKMNKQGAVGFAEGGVVQYFAEGGSALKLDKRKGTSHSTTPRQSGAGVVQKQSVALGQHLHNLGVSAKKVLLAMDAFEKGQRGANTTIDRLGRAAKVAGMELKTTSQVTKQNMELDQKHAAMKQQMLGSSAKKGASPASTVVTGGGGGGAKGGGVVGNASKEIKGMGMNAGMSAMMIAGMAQGMVDQETAAGKVAGKLLNMVMQIGMVIMALEMFGISLSKASLDNLMKGKTAGGRSVKDMVVGKKSVSTNVMGHRTQTAPGTGMTGFREASRNRGRTSMAAGRKQFSSGKGGGFLKRAGGMLKGGKSMGGGAISRVAGGAAGLATGPAGALAAVAGPALAVVGGLALFSKALSASFGYQEAYNKAIEEGNAVKAEELAVLSQSTGITQGLDALWALIPGAELGDFADGMANFSALFGGKNAKTIKDQARITANLNKLKKGETERVKASTEALEKFKDGTISANEAIKISAAGFRESIAIDKDQKKASRAVTKEFRDKDAYSGDGYWSAMMGGAMDGLSDGARNIGSFVSFGAMDSASGRRSRIEGEEKQAQEKTSKVREEEFGKFMTSTQDARRGAAATGGSLDDVIKASGVKREDLSSTEFDQLKKEYENHVKAIKENIAFLEALNFGLREASGNAMAISGSMERLVASQESGFNAFEQGLQVLEQSLTEAAVGMNEAEIAAAADSLGQTLIGFGATDEEAKKASDTVRGLSAAQSGAGDALEKAKEALLQPGGGKAKTADVQDAFESEMRTQLAGMNLAPGVEDRILNGLGDIDFSDAKVQEQVKSGNFSAILDQTFGPLSEEIKKQLLGPYQERAKQEGILINLTRERIQLEQQANQAKKTAIDIEMEAAQAIADFGGRQVTSEDKKSAINRKLDIDLSAAGIGSVGGGSVNELAAAQQNISGDFNALQQKSNLAAAGGKGAFGGVKGVEDDKRPQLEAAQQSLITATRARIALVKEEMDIIKRKNELEKSSLDKLLSGDIEGFFEGQAATGAASALRTGNQALIGSFSASSVGRGFQDLQGQNLPAQQMERIASGALGSLGVQDRRSAQVLSGNTAEEQAKRAEGQQLAGILGAAGAGAAEMAEMAVDAKLVVIKTQGLKMGDAANVPQPQVGGMASGGVVYANRGIFVPRGTDTVPAMLTPGEFVVNRASVQRGNNLAILQAMNNGQQAAPGPAMNRGGSVRYYHDGDHVAPGGGGAGVGISAETVNSLNNVFTAFDATVDKLKQMKLSVQLDPSTINVNFNNTSFLSSLTTTINEAVLKEVKNQIPNISQGTNGLSHDHSVLKDKP